MKNDIDNVQKLFAFYGWSSCPIPRKKIASLLIRGKSHDQIYVIGCQYEAAHLKMERKNHA